MLNKVVARFVDGRVLKGMTADFSPTKDVFHLALADAPGQAPLEVRAQDLKALFFVKDHAGNPGYDERKEFESTPSIAERPIQVVFQDGEVLVGTTSGYRAGRPGFFLTPADPESNNERCYVITAAAREITFI